MDISRLIISFIIAGILTIPLITILRLKGKIGKNTERIIEDAKADGRVVTAVKTKELWMRGLATDPDLSQTQRRHDIKTWYEYMVNGCIYKQVFLSEHYLPEEITLYYPKGYPKRAVYEGQPDYSPINIFMTLLPVLLAALIYNVWSIIVDPAV